ncbi:MAG: site-2 protease family protein [Elainellaceae cyanobacterium]
MLFWLLLLGLFTYLIIYRSVSSLTRTPIWLLWLVMMMPAFVWIIAIAYREQSGTENEPVLIAVLLLSFIVSPIIYWILIQKGRPERSPDSPSPIDSAKVETQPLMPTTTLPETRLPLDRDEEATLKACFSWAVFYLKNLEYRPQALICRGHLRTSPEVAYKTVRENVVRHFGDRFLLVFQEGLDGKPFFALVPNPQKAKKQSAAAPTFRPGLAIGLLVTTFMTTTFAGSVFAGAMSEDWQGDLDVLLVGLPYAAALMLILSVHELGHYFTARRYRIQSTLPYFIPVPPAPIFPFGTFGAFIQMRSPIPNRKALFDVGISGPIAGFIVTIPILLWGLAHSGTVSLTEDSSILNFESFRPASSLLIALLSKLALGGDLTSTTAIELHPVAIAGLLGLVVTALNLMPVGQLDGGHVVHAMFGQRMGAAIGQVSRFLVLALAFVQREFLIWAILLFFMPVIDEPALNDVTELDNRRDFLGLVALGLLVLIILPAPPVLADLLF